MTPNAWSPEYKRVEKQHAYNHKYVDVIRTFFHL